MTQLATGNNNGGGAITGPQAQRRGILKGEDDDDTILPRLHIFQGLPDERKLFGDFKPGQFINTLSRKVMGEAKFKFVPIFGWVEYIKFGAQRGTGIEYRTREKSMIDPKDLEFTIAVEDGKQVQVKPRTTKFINFAVLIEGDSDPICLSFKSTMLNAGRTINTLEKMRGNKGPGYYELTLVERRNGKGTWLAPRIAPLGNPPADMSDLAVALFNSMSPDLVTTNVDDAPGGDAADPNDFDPNADR